MRIESIISHRNAEAVNICKNRKFFPYHVSIVKHCLEFMTKNSVDCPYYPRHCIFICNTVD